MTLPSAKELARLAKACRKAGILTFKGGGIEFTLSEATPLAKTPRKANLGLAEAANTPPGEPETDEFTREQLLSWSVPDFDKADQ